MSLGTILLVLLILMLLGVLPTWPHSRSWGYGPSGAIGAIVVILLILALLGRLYAEFENELCNKNRSDHGVTGLGFLCGGL